MQHSLSVKDVLGTRSDHRDPLLHRQTTVQEHLRREEGDPTHRLPDTAVQTLPSCGLDVRLELLISLRDTRVLQTA